MNNNYIRKIQFSGWTKRRWKEIRPLIKKLTEKEIKSESGRKIPIHKTA